MNDIEQKLREAIRKRVRELLDEISTTAGVPGYLTPNAFVGDKRSMKKHIQKIAQSVGYSLTKRGEEDTKPGDKLNENYYAYRNDETHRPHQKIGMAISEINKQFKLIERALRMNERLKKEKGITNEQLWKRTTNQMTKLEGKLIELASRLREMRS